MNSMAPSVKQNFYRDQKRSIQKKTETEKVSKRRIYIEDYPPEKVLSLLEELEPYYAFTKEYCELISEEGLFRMNKKEKEREKENLLVLLKQKDLPVVSKKNYLPGKHLLVDYSHFEEIADISQIPVEHTLLNYTCFHYCFYGTAVKRSLLYLVIEGTFREKFVETSQKNRYKGFTITDLYFISDEDVENSLIKKELNEFLLLLI